MSKDIRSFFSSVAAKPARAITPKRKQNVLDDDSDEEKVKMPKKSKDNSEALRAKKRRVIYSSDEDEPIVSKETKTTIASKVAKLKTVDVSNAFGNGPVKRIEKVKKPKQSKDADVFDADTDDMELMNVDEEILSPKPTKQDLNKKDVKVKEEIKSPVKEKIPLKVKNTKSPEKVKQEKKSPVKNEKRTPDESKEEKKGRKKDSDSDQSSKKKPATPASNKKPKQSHDESELDRSVYDEDQEKFERRRAAAALYKQMQKRAGPSAPGSKEIPKGEPNCLTGLKFVLTGVYESMEREEAAAVIRDLGGSVTTAISGKTNYVVSGLESGPAKLAKAEDLGISILSEDDLLDLIREKSGQPTHNKKVKEEMKSPKKEAKKSSKDAKKDKRTPVKSESPKKVKVEEKRVETEEPKFTPSTPQINKDIPQPWVEKYKPKDIKEIIGQQGPASNLNKLIKWLQNWYKNNDGKKKHARPNPWAKNDDGAAFKAALLSGPPGVGKTTTATLVCKHLGYDTIEFNASTTRSKKLLQNEVAGLVANKTLHGYSYGHNETLTQKKVLLMDEVDGMAGNEDRGGLAELIGIIKSSSIPIICMCNDRNHQKMRSLVNYCFDLRFARPQLPQIKGAIMSILFKEGVKLSPKTIEEVIQATNQDVRQTLNSLSLICAKPDAEGSGLRNDNGKKDLRLGPWEVVRKVFSAEEHKKMTLNDKADLFFHDYSLGPLFVQQNYLSVVPNGPKSKTMEQVALTADSLSLGDLVENRIRSRQNWSILPVQAMYSSVLPGEYMSGQITAQINFPGWLGKYSRTQKRSRMAQEIHDHTRIRTSASRESIRLDYAPFLLHNIVQPMIDDQNDGVEESLNVMKEYRLLREDIDSLVELTSWPGKKSEWDSVDGRVKAALTRAYNKEIAPYSYSTVTAAKKKKVAASDEDYMNELGDGEAQFSDSDDGDDDKLENDTLIKSKKGGASSKAGGSGKGSKASSSGSSRSSASTSKKAASSKKK
ncbi:replication factor C subunit 1 isoform X2 [Contarinia nasturtii]|uniref:replication factor C subunit 1 isoform X2 n=1 Tax=Contarinia nasturtii TaxID=265458 RepID=UPI0012D46278|nr:replication factor C subunit 1 isoform X2 [Contarinia nasturtii]